MTPYEVIERKLRDNMVPGQRHKILRDIGRLAGGYLAAGKLSLRDVADLEGVAVGLAERSGYRGADREWRDAVEFGRMDPVRDTDRATVRGSNIGWDDVIHVGPEHAPSIIDEHWVESADIDIPGEDWQPAEDLIRYLELVFEPDEHVGLVTRAWQPEGEDRWLPTKGVCDRTRQDLVAAIRKHGHDLGAAIGDTDDAAGAWVRINPLDGSGGVKDMNVTAFRHALIEADDQDLGKQLALIRELQLPCSAIVHSGGKSIHAIVRVDAEGAAEYRHKVDKLYQVCKANGLKVDEQNRNPSRLSRLPGIYRNGRPQFLIDGRCGQPNFEAWMAHVEEMQDDLPDPEQIPASAELLPPLAPELIDGLLREGHKMRVSGPSKAGKSFGLIGLAVAIAEGREWMGFKCAQGPVLYVNLELDRRSCMHRFIRVYEALGWSTTTISAIDVWNLRGHVCPLDKLAPKLIRRAVGKGYKAVILDPIYKIQTGDENDPGDVARFCNQLDAICTQLGTAVIDCHHHSKGQQGQKRAMDRASGSGVFGRDPDAILDLIELELSKDRRDRLDEAVVRQHLEDWAAAKGLDMDEVPITERGPTETLVRAMQAAFPHRQPEIAAQAYQAHQRAARMSGWRIEGSLREFPPFEPVRVWFDHPVHITDTWELLADAKAAGEEPPWEAQRRTKDEARKAKAEEAAEALENAIEASGGAGAATVADVAEVLGCDTDTVRNRLRKSAGFTFKNGIIMERNNDR